MVHKRKISYDKAVKDIAFLEDKAKLDAKLNTFDKSLILSVLFGVPKQKTMDDLVEERVKKL